MTHYFPPRIIHPSPENEQLSPESFNFLLIVLECSPLLSIVLLFGRSYPSNFPTFLNYQRFSGGAPGAALKILLNVPVQHFLQRSGFCNSGFQIFCNQQKLYKDTKTLPRIPIEKSWKEECKPVACSRRNRLCLATTRFRSPSCSFLAMGCPSYLRGGRWKAVNSENLSRKVVIYLDRLFRRQMPRRHRRLTNGVASCRGTAGRC
jgi:hypothetical protein